MEQAIIVNYMPQLDLGNIFQIELRIENYLGYVEDVKALFNKNGQKPGEDGKCYLEYSVNESTSEISIFKGKRSFTDIGYRTFYIELKLNSELKYIKLDPISLKPTLTNDENSPHFEIFIYCNCSKIPDGIAGGIMYQIFIDTFYSEEKSNLIEWKSFPKWIPDEDGEYRNNKFYGGNIQGIIKKLPYIKSLGTTILYITPVFESPSQNGYDISDYTKVNKRFGTWEDLYELKEKANDIGILLVLDCVFNHSSIENRLFFTHPDMYDWITKYTNPKTWWGFRNLVEFNKYSDKYAKELKKWLNLYSQYVDGIRLDVADSLPDFVLKYIRRNFPGKYILGEVWKNAIKGDFRDFLCGDELDAVMNYQFANAIYRYIRWGNYRYFKKVVVNDVYNLYPRMYLDICPIFLSSHDIPRIPNILAGEFMKEDPAFENVWDMEKSKEWFIGEIFSTYEFRKWEYLNDNFAMRKFGVMLQRLAVFMQYTLPGIPSIFAGDEMGVIGFKDPFNRKPMPWDNIDFSVKNFYIRIGKFRHKYREFFAHGDFEIVHIDEEKCIYRRNNMIFIVNRTNQDINISSFIGKKKIVFHTASDWFIGNPSRELAAYNAIALTEMEGA